MPTSYGRRTYCEAHYSRVHKTGLPGSSKILRTEKHGETGSVEYAAHKAMLHRCYSPTNRVYRHYGARGITVCRRWRNSFKNFLKDMGRRPRPGMSLDRIDNSKGYCPENCRWATPRQQSNNRRGLHRVEYLGETRTLAGWAKKTGIKRETIAARLKYGWDVGQALNGPLKDRVLITFNGETRTLAQWCEVTGLKKTTFYGRLYRGWSYEKAISTPMMESFKRR